MKLISITMPTLDRSRQAGKVRRSIYGQELPHDWICRMFTLSKKTNWLQEINDDLVMNATGQIIFQFSDSATMETGCLKAIIEAFEKNFPDFDGAVSPVITNMPGQEKLSQYAFTAFGHKYLKETWHNPDVKNCGPFCLDYHHFYADTELGMYFEKHGKWISCKDAKVIKLHPKWGGTLEDDTFRWSRRRTAKDFRIMKKREAKGLLWGETWERINFDEGMK